MKSILKLQGYFEAIYLCVIMNIYIILFIIVYHKLKFWYLAAFYLHIYYIHLKVNYIYYYSAFTIFCIVLNVLIIWYWQRIRVKKWMRKLFNFNFISQSLLLVLIGAIIFEQEWNYFWKSFYVEYYLYFAGVVVFFTMPLVICWVYIKFVKEKS